MSKTDIEKEKAQPFEELEPLASIILHAANNWQVDFNSWNDLLRELNRIAIEQKQLQKENKQLEQDYETLTSENIKALKTLNNAGERIDKLIDKNKELRGGLERAIKEIAFRSANGMTLPAMILPDLKNILNKER